MFLIHRVAPAVVLAAASLLLSACGSTSGQFDPTEWLDFEFTRKPPLPGERKAVFPEGVPGVPDGVPKEMVKGNQPPPIEEAAVTAPEPPQAKRAQPARPQTTRPAPKPRTASAPPRPTAAQPATRPQPASQPSAAPWPDPTPVQAAPKPAAPAWPEPNAQANWPPPDPNAFSR